MRKIIDSILKSVSEFFSKLEKREKIRLAVLAAFIVVLAIVVAVVLGRVTYSTLYSGLDAASAGEIITALDEMGIPYKTEGTGTILVAEGNVSQARMQLASQGYLSGGFDYDIYSQAGGFGTSDVQEQAYRVFQAEYQARQQILTISKVQDCLVMINMPKTTSFVLSDNTEQASASVTLELKSGQSLTESEVDAIAHIVSGGAAVPVENVYIIDTNARFYRVGENDGTGTTALAHQLELENQVRTQLETQVVNLLSTVFGTGRVKASVAVTLNFDKETVQSVEFAPPVEGETEGLVISMSELYEYTHDAEAGGVVGTDSNGIGTVEYPYGSDEGYDYRYIAREFNYEINETVTQLEKAQATIKNLSIAVLVDSEAIESDYTENVQNLVVNAIGVNENYISVERLPFQTTSNEFTDAIEAQNEMFRQMRNSEILQLIINGVIILLLALAILAFLRTLLAPLFRKREAELARAGMPVGAVGENVDYFADDDGAGKTKDIDLSSKSESITMLEKFIDKDSMAIAQMLRNWLSDES